MQRLFNSGEKRAAEENEKLRRRVGRRREWLFFFFFVLLPLSPKLLKLNFVNIERPDLSPYFDRTAYDDMIHRQCKFIEVLLTVASSPLIWANEIPLELSAVSNFRVRCRWHLWVGKCQLQYATWNVWDSDWNKNLVSLKGENKMNLALNYRVRDEVVDLLLANVFIGFVLLTFH